MLSALQLALTIRCIESQLVIQQHSVSSKKKNCELQNATPKQSHTKYIINLIQVLHKSLLNLDFFIFKR